MRARGATVKARPTAPLPVASLVIGKPVEEAAELLPRLFNLCRTAQDIAARMAFGLPLTETPKEDLTREILRDHLLKFCVTWPGFFGGRPQPIPQISGSDTAVVRAALFGPLGSLPEEPGDFAMFLASGSPITQVLHEIRTDFGPGEACAADLTAATRQNVFGAAALENSVAARQAHRPVMRHIEEEFGRGPLWRATARLYDAQDCLTGRLQDVAIVAPGRAVVPAARGLYAISAEIEDGHVKNFRRITPTDHLLAPGGVLDQSLANLPREKADLAGLVLDILDPCMPVSLMEVDDA
ncbi:hypothetical protein [Roseibium sp.]|uniref:hypothetical protein n=1 Tax=Roseibium sp. TaxID=1936156 RepID=UPI003D0D8DEF